MNTVIRDLQCSMDVKRMAELGRYDEEFFAYGFSWYEEGKRHYFLSGECEAAYEEAHKMHLQGFGVTPVQEYMSRRAVPSGMYYDFNQETKVALAKQLQDKYHPLYFENIIRVGRIKNDEYAYDRISKMQDHLEGKFERDRLNYFRSIIQDTYIAKKITQAQYQAVNLWLEKNYKQMEDDLVVEERFSKIFGGFCYQYKNEAWKLYLNAQPSCVYQMHAKYLQEGACIFPIFWKTFWYDQVAEGNKLRERFKKIFVEILNDTLGSAFLEIKKMPPQIDRDTYQKARQNIEAQGTAEERDAWRMLGSIWGIYEE